MRRCLKRCRHCRIFFLTTPSNDKRTDLRCPFGCRESHRKQCSTQRSIEYYRNPKGRTQKRALNRKRYLVVKEEDAEPMAEVEEATEAEPLAEPIVDYVRSVTSLIEGRNVSRGEIAEMLGTISRQHRLWRRRRIDYVVEELNKDPP